MPWHLCANHRHSHSGQGSRGPQNKPKEPSASNFSRASYAKRKRLQCEDIDDIDAWQDMAHKRAKISVLAKRERDVELTQLNSNSKVARIYESILSRFKGRNLTSSSSS